MGFQLKCTLCSKIFATGPSELGNVVCQIENQTKSRKNQGDYILQVHTRQRNRTQPKTVWRDSKSISSSEISRYYFRLPRDSLSKSTSRTSWIAAISGNTKFIRLALRLPKYICSKLLHDSSGLPYVNDRLLSCASKSLDRIAQNPPEEESISSNRLNPAWDRFTAPLSVVRSVSQLTRFNGVTSQTPITV